MMKKRYKDQKGYITVYLSLMSGIIISLVTTVLYGARLQTIRFKTECVMNIGLESIFAEYHRQLLDQYGLLFIDSSYGTGKGSITNTKNRLMYYLNLNFRGSTGNVILRDLTDIRADNAVLYETAYASDDFGEVLRYQIDRYMKIKYGIGYIPVFKGDIADMEGRLNEFDGYDSDRRSKGEEVDSLMESINAAREENEEPYSISNPADSVEYLSDSNVLFYALGDVSELGLLSTDVTELISHRKYKKGAGLRDDQDKPDGPDSKFLLIDYIYDKCGYYENEKDDSALLYEIEYLIEGKNSDIENMEEIAGKIFKIRYAVNMTYLLSDTAKQSEAEALALAATTAIGMPELTEAVKYTILFAWGYAESAKDLRILYDGHKLSAIKDDMSWNTPLSQLTDFKAHLNEYSISDGELDYKAFLNIFLALESTQDITMRLMDIMEMDIRKTPGNAAFCMDDQIYQLAGEANISSNFGYGCSIRRYYSYE